MPAARWSPICVGGHGLVAVFFAMFEDCVDRAVVLDRTRQENFDRILLAAAEAAPWTKGRIEYIEAKLHRAPDMIPDDAGLVAVHACGVKTDRVLDLAVANNMPVAVMPCCHPVAQSKAPAAVKKALAHMAVDVDRTYRMEAAGFHVKWSEIPERVTRMNRVVLARPRAAAQS